MSPISKLQRSLVKSRQASSSVCLFLARTLLPITPPKRKKIANRPDANFNISAFLSNFKKTETWLRVRQLFLRKICEIINGKNAL